MKRVFLMGLVALMATACTKSKEAAVTATIEGGAQQEIVVAKLAVSQMRIVDTLKADAQGVAKGKIVLSENAPEFYYLVCNGNRVASLILKPGDKVSVKADTLGNGLVIEGSEESVLLQKYQEGLAAVNREYTAITSKLLDAVESSDTKLAQQVSQQLNKLYLKYRQSVTKMIMENPYSFANVQAIYQSIGNEPPLFSADNDYLLIQRVHDSLAVKYPNSVYLKSLQSDIKARQNALILAEKISKAEESSYPNLILPDINAKSVELQSLKGRPFILMFWTISEASQKMFNNDLKELYKKYSNNGLEVYQVSLDADKTAWATAVKEQQLPWISVCDGKGAVSPAVAAYNVVTVPYMYVFDKNGDMVAHGNLTSRSEIEAAIKKAVK